MDSDEQNLTNCMDSIMQNKANFLKDKINATFFATKDYENERLRGPRGKQTQSNPISNFLLGMSYGENCIF